MINNILNPHIQYLPDNVRKYVRLLSKQFKIIQVKQTRADRFSSAFWEITYSEFGENEIFTCELMAD